jgi:NitT/TauT family transport system permease protein
VRTESLPDIEAVLKDGEARGRLGRVLRIRPTAVVSLASVVVLVGVWALLSLGHLVSNRFLVSPVEVVREIGALFQDGYINVPFHVHLGYSIMRSLSGLVLAIVLGVPVGLLIGYNRYVAAMFLPPFLAFRPVPPIALIPLAVLWFGIGEFAKIVLIFMASFLYVTLSVANGVKEVRESLIRAGRSLGANGRQLFFYVIFPETLPQIMNSIKVGTAISWAVVVAAELVAAQKGLGYMIMGRRDVLQDCRRVRGHRVHRRHRIRAGARDRHGREPIRALERQVSVTVFRGTGPARHAKLIEQRTGRVSPRQSPRGPGREGIDVAVVARCPRGDPDEHDRREDESCPVHPCPRARDHCSADRPRWRIRRG